MQYSSKGGPEASRKGVPGPILPSRESMPLQMIRTPYTECAKYRGVKTGGGGGGTGPQFSYNSIFHFLLERISTFMTRPFHFVCRFDAPEEGRLKSQI